MENTIKIHCTCESEFQDKKYGKGIRVHNIGIKGGSVQKEVGGHVSSATCTVCSTKKTNL